MLAASAPETMTFSPSASRLPAVGSTAVSEPLVASTLTSTSCPSCVSASSSTDSVPVPSPRSVTAALGTMSVESIDCVMMLTSAVMPGLRRGSGAGITRSTA